MKKDFSKLRNLDRRLARIESVCGDDDLLLHFENGSTRVLRISRSSGERGSLLYSAVNWYHHARSARHGDRYDCDPPGEKPATLEIPEPRMKVFRFLSSAKRVETDDKTVAMIWGLCVSAAAAEKEPWRPGELIHTSYSREISALPPEEQQRVAPAPLPKNPRLRRP